MLSFRASLALSLLAALAAVPAFAARTHRTTSASRAHSLHKAAPKSHKLHGQQAIDPARVTEIQQAHQLLAPLLGSTFASILFAGALLCSGQSSTLTGTMAGQIVMEGFLRFRMQPWLRRAVTRTLAPVVLVAALVALSCLCCAICAARKSAGSLT